MFDAHKFALGLLLLCLLTLNANAGLILQGNDSAHIALGNQGTNASVGWVASDGGRGSFTVIDNGFWGLTSFHVVSNDINRTAIFSNLRTGFGNFFTPTQQTSSFQVFLHPTKDIALFKFDTAFTGVTPLERFTGTVANGMEGYTVGFGRLQYLNDPNVTFTGDRRAGFDVVNGVNPFESENFRTRIDFSNNANYRPLEMGGRPGDSGGAFISNGLLAGITDSAQLTNAIGTATYYTRLDNDWINATITAVPEPGSIALLSLGSSLFLWRRVRRNAA